MSIFTQLVKSIYSPKDIARFRFQKVGKTILYILLLSLLATIPETTQFGTMLKQQFSQLQNMVTSELPDFTIENGELRANISEPIIKEDETFTFLFDPNTTEYKSDALNGLYILQDRAITVSAGQVQTYTYDTFKEWTVTKEDIETFLSRVKSMYPIALFIIGFFLFLVNAFTTFIGVTFVAFIGNILARSLQRPMQYKQAWTLTAYSFTLPTVFFIIMDSLRIHVSAHLFVFLFTAIFVLYLTIKEIPPKK
ncbi:DUF1189 domain-containing protein [Ectobacillus antri]|jgi:hypothetical protein|uniref:DUF1189 domain-containing protein n=1 Tax=Ectobacillus antri TaxID=2486280 RepID=A0ABT6H4E9_9BACI|nr:DUF1189 domain-containing protein [Ectobacillus antri]MDG4655518.1 DUF1189 domain-containing protein [Ectobacillus antri]MDG5753276.1 DUF1189 domain-containing protein [Ectobacillus antri]